MSAQSCIHFFDCLATGIVGYALGWITALLVEVKHER